jgi:N-acetylmuramic acid 6-phosphate etherase
MSTIVSTPPPPLQYFLCVDGGGSKCTAVLISSTGTTLVGEAGPCNPSTIGLDATVGVISTAINAALAETGEALSNIANLPIASAWIGVAGYDRPTLAVSINKAMSQLLGLPLGPRLRITADIDLLAVNAAQWQPACQAAIVLVAGTGSVAMSYSQKNEDDVVMTRSGRVGGWGPLLGDDGSGFAIGRDALRVALRTSDAWQGDYTTDDKAAPALSRAVFDYFKQEQASERLETGVAFHPRDLLSSILTSSSASPTKTIANAVRIVLSLIDDGSDKEGQARRILENGAASLADLVIELLRVQDLDPTQTGLIMAGGLLCQDTYSLMVRDELAKRKVRFQWSTSVQSPAMKGAQFLAVKRIGVE